ncbi:MAG: ATP phosphoribosyltransferase regulatory subunit [Bacillota bacterium]|nr:ATP phosphoribosyltransferase regulatory subunit [Bacillota bacterium]
MEQARYRLPAGVVDQGPAEREAIETLTAQLVSLFANWGYRRVEPPVFEYFETFACGGASFSEERVYRFLDRNGKLLALRPEMTAGIARMAAAQLSGATQQELAAALPLRLCYAGPVFRSESPGSGTPHSFQQGGVELIGMAAAGADAEADAEVIAVALAAVNALLPGRARVVVGHAGLAWQALAAAAAPSAQRAAEFRAAARQRDLVALQGLLGPELAALIAGGPYARPQAGAILAGLGRAGEGLASGAAELEALFGALEDYGVEDLALDLSLLRDLDYYTGMVFEVTVNGLARPIAGGGRYDRLLERFGLAVPATGFALDITAAANPGRGQGEPDGRGPVVVATACRGERRSAMAIAATLRAAGFRVETRLVPEPLSAALNACRARGAVRLLYCEGGAYREIRVLAASPGFTDDPPAMAAGHQSIH